MKRHFEDDGESKRQRELAYNFMKTHQLAVMSTVTGDCNPQAAVVGIAVEENLEIICSTFTTSRKYQNIKYNPRVALVIGWEHGKTIQYEGEAKEITDDISQELLQTLAKAPSIGKYLVRENQVFYRIKPRWIRFSDLSIDPWQRFEISFQ